MFIATAAEIYSKDRDGAPRVQSKRYIHFKEGFLLNIAATRPHRPISKGTLRSHHNNVLFPVLKMINIAKSMRFNSTRLPVAFAFLHETGPTPRIYIVVYQKATETQSTRISFTLTGVTTG